MDTTENLREFIRSFVKISGRVGLYGFNHPASGLAITAFWEGLCELLKAGKELTLTAADGKILVNSEAIEDKSPLYDAFSKVNLHSLTFFPGVDKGEVVTLLKGLASGTGLEELFSAEGVRHIKVNTVYYIKTGEKAAPADEDDNDQFGPIESLQKASFDMLIKKVVEKAVKKDEDRKKVFELVMGRFKNELEDRVKDATRHLETEKGELMREKRNTDSVIESTVLGSITVDGSGNVLMLDPDGERIVGAKLRDMANRPVWESLSEGQMVTVTREGAGALTVSDIMVKGADETKRVLKASNAIIKNVEGKMVGLFSVLSDITRYRELDQMKKDFVAGVTHELRTPLVATKQALSNLLNLTEGLGPDQKKMIEIALRNTERLSRLVNDILDFSKLEAGKLKLRQEIVETGQLFKEVVATIKPLSDYKGVAVELDAPIALPRLFVDRDRATQVLINLLSNAIKFTEKGGTVTIAAPSLWVDGNNTFLEITVRDTGCGIEKKDLGRIFEKFVQAGSEKNGMRGTGLGLTITRAIVELHGGRLSVQSEPGKGSVFAAALPMLPEDAVFMKKREYGGAGQNIVDSKFAAKAG